MTETNRMPLGIKAVLVFHILNVALWSVGQTGALLDYDGVAALGLQDPRNLVDPAIVEVNHGIAVADTVIMLPLFLIAIIGLLRRRFFGLLASWLVLGITLYWPVVYWASLFHFGRAGVEHVPLTASTLIVPGAFLLGAAWAAWYLTEQRAMFR